MQKGCHVGNHFCIKLKLSYRLMFGDRQVPVGCSKNERIKIDLHCIVGDLLNCDRGIVHSKVFIPVAERPYKRNRLRCACRANGWPFIIHSRTVGIEGYKIIFPAWLQVGVLLINRTIFITIEPGFLENPRLLGQSFSN